MHKTLHQCISTCSLQGQSLSGSFPSCYQSITEKYPCEENKCCYFILDNFSINWNKHPLKVACAFACLQSKSNKKLVALSCSAAVQLLIHLAWDSLSRSIFQMNLWLFRVWLFGACLMLRWRLWLYSWVTATVLSQIECAALHPTPHRDPEWTYARHSTEQNLSIFVWCLKDSPSIFTEQYPQVKWSDTKTTLGLSRLYFTLLQQIVTKSRARLVVSRFKGFIDK